MAERLHAGGSFLVQKKHDEWEWNICLSGLGIYIDPSTTPANVGQYAHECLGIMTVTEPTTKTPFTV